MTEFRSVTPEFSVAQQLTAADFARAAEAGFKVIINNRPDGEAPGQLSSQEARAAAEAAGLAYHHIPVSGGPSPAVVGEMAAALEAARAGPVLAYCRSGTRSITAWAMAQAVSGSQEVDEIVALARGAGYDIAGAEQLLRQLARG